MPAALAELTFLQGTGALHCPATGRLVIHPEEGLDTEAEQTPHVRFFWDWVGEPYLADPAELPPDQAGYQRKLIHFFSDDDDVAERFDGFDAVIAACREVMPASVLILKLETAAQGSDQGESCWIAFDLAPMPEDGPRSVSLIHADQLIDQAE